MEYYLIQLSIYAIKLCTFILPLLKYHYKCLLMGVRKVPKQIRQKMSNLFQAFEIICVYIDELLILEKGRL